MENENTVQPLDMLMTKLGLANADLVKASTEQLSFKMVQKGRAGRRLSPNIQDKILNALLKAKPELKIRRRELFHYPMDESVVAKIHEAVSLFEKKEIKYPSFIDLLAEAGVNYYAVKVASNESTFYGSNGEAHILEAPAINQAVPGIVSYEVNLRQRKIVYRGQTESYREDIPLVGSEPEIKEAAPVEPVKAPVKKKPVARKKKPGIVRKTRKARLTARKLFFRKRKNKGPRSKGTR